MKYRLFPALAIIMFSGNCFANSITFSTEGINLDVPNNFTTVTEYNVPPKALRDFNTSSKAILNDLKKAKEVFHLAEGDNVVLTGGVIDGNTGNTNMIKVETI